ncbi:structural maintenance of chromosomes protein 5, partial [Tanacetum coccineum]
GAKVKGKYKDMEELQNLLHYEPLREKIETITAEILDFEQSAKENRYQTKDRVSARQTAKRLYMQLDHADKVVKFFEKTWLTDLCIVLRPKIIVCKTSTATVIMVVRFLPVPTVMLVASMAVALQRTLLHAKHQCIILSSMTLLCVQVGVSALGALVATQSNEDDLCDE